MAITATFKADFSSFLQAIDKAEVALVDMSKGASKVESSLNRMIDSFSGRKLIQEATLMTIAVEKAGGVASLTAKELERVGAVANEAADKMRRLGYEVPAGIQKLADATKTTNKELGSMQSIVKDVYTDLIAMVSVRAAFNFVKGVVDAASALQDLSNETHIDVEELQLLAGAMSEFGVDAETLGKGLFGLSRRIAAGDDSVAKALDRMGLSLEDVRGLNGEELFLNIEHGLSQLQGGLRDTTASELFGSKLGMAMAGASEGIDGALESAHRLNAVMSRESVEAMDRFGESIERANRNISAIAANMLGPLADGFNVVVAAVEKGAPKWDIFVAMVKDFGLSLLPGVTSATNLATVLDHLNQQTEQNAASTPKATAVQRAHAGAMQVTAASTRDSAAAQKEYNDLLKQVEAIEQKVRASIDFSIAKVGERSKAELDYVNASIAGTKQLEQIQSENADFIMRTTLSETDYKIAKINEWEQATIAAFKGTDVQLAAYTDAVHARAMQQIASIQQVTVAITAQEQALAQLAQDAITTFAVIGSGSPASLLRPDTQGGIQAGPVGGSATSPGFVMPGFSLPPFSLSARAGGGPVSVGQTYMVGEKGPELFRPSSSGFIDSGKGGATVYNTFNIVDTEANIARRVSDQITRTIKQATKWGAA